MIFFSIGSVSVNVERTEESGAVFNDMAPCSTGIPRFIVLCFILLCSYCVFFKLKACCNSVVSKSFGAIFPVAFAHFVFLCHVFVIFTSFQTFPLLLHLL